MVKCLKTPTLLKMPTRRSTMLQGPVNLENLWEEIATMSFRSGILTVVTGRMTGMTLVRQTIVTKFSRIFSTLTPNRDPKAAMPFVMTSGNVSTTMSGMTSTPKAEKKVMMREGTVASARIVAGTARMWSVTTMSRARTMCASIISAVGKDPVIPTTTAGIAASRASVKIAPTTLGSIALTNMIAVKQLAWRPPISAKTNAMCASVKVIRASPLKDVKPSETTAATILTGGSTIPT
mmetsp:Transcript_10639/g.25033  ORF Transcript_10639/g.25033 Transcript_10639/m.25033 type:complete len:236 (-) Transcript_10639:512-1219(-)